MTDIVLKDLAQEVKDLSASGEQIARRRRWADLLNLRPTRPLVNFYMYPNVWAREIVPGGGLCHGNGLAGEIELDLRARLWKAKHYPDDTPLLPIIWTWAQPSKREEHFPWGLPMDLDYSDTAGGAYRPRPPIHDEKDLAKLRTPRFECDNATTNSKIAQVSELTGGVLPVKAKTDELHWGPFEYAVRLRGMDNLLLDFYDRPEFVHELMRKITDGAIAYQNQREAAGAVDAEGSFLGHASYDEIPAGCEHRLKGYWAYIHAQSSASISPEMYAEFIHPYNCRLASLVGKNYYHGCEDLSRKCRIIQDLPGLRLFHVSPWTPPEPVMEVLGNRFVLEVHSHPTNVLFTFSRQQIKDELAARHKAVGDAHHVLTLADVETVGPHPEMLMAWGQVALEIANGQ